MITRALGVVAILAMCAGCATGDAREYYAKAGVSRAQASRDVEDCQELASRVLPGGATGGTYRRVDPGLFDKCMRARGYELEIRGQAPRESSP